MDGLVVRSYSWDEVFVESFRVVKSCWRLLVRVLGEVVWRVVLWSVVVSVVGLGWVWAVSVFGGDSFVGLAAGLVVLGLVWLVLVARFVGAGNWASMRVMLTYFSGVSGGPVEEFRAGLRVVWPVLGLLALVSVGGVVGTVLLIVPGLIWSVSMLPALPVMVVEGVGPVAAVRRSWRLVSGRRWDIFGSWFLVSVVVSVCVSVLSFVSVGLGVGAFVAAVAGVASGGGVMWGLFVVAGLVGLLCVAVSVFSTLVQFVVLAACQVVVYVDLVARSGR